MIVRIATEGQYRLDSSYLDHLNAIDNEIVTCLAENNQDRFAARFLDLLTLVRDHGEQLAADELVESDIVLPPPDTTFEEATHLFDDDGLVPG